MTYAELTPVERLVVDHAIACMLDAAARFCGVTITTDTGPAQDALAAWLTAPPDAQISLTFDSAAAFDSPQSFDNVEA